MSKFNFLMLNYFNDYVTTLSHHYHTTKFHSNSSKFSLPIRDFSLNCTTFIIPSIQQSPLSSSKGSNSNNIASPYYLTTVINIAQHHYLIKDSNTIVEGSSKLSKEDIILQIQIMIGGDIKKKAAIVVNVEELEKDHRGQKN
ncbi:hypothetical protein ACTFIU_007744 [Dictyostelium citrinum]